MITLSSVLVTFDARTLGASREIISPTLAEKRSICMPAFQAVRSSAFDVLFRKSCFTRHYSRNVSYRPDITRIFQNTKFNTTRSLFAFSLRRLRYCRYRSLVFLLWRVPVHIVTRTTFQTSKIFIYALTIGSSTHF